MKKRASEAWRFLVPLISPWDFGWKRDGGIARPTKADVIEAFNARRHGRYRWARKKMLDHFSGERTLYFAADGRTGRKLVLGMFDIDCHRRGCLEHALAFAVHLKKFFPDLYVEPSTNGKGVHGYFLLEKGDLGDRYVRTLFAHIQVWAEDEYDRWQAANPDKPIDGVEIKGSPARLEWSPDGRLEDMTMGTLAKLPRQVVDRFDEFQATSRISIKTLKDLLGRVVLGEGLTGKFVRQRLGRPRAAADAPASVSSRKMTVRSGSTAGHPVDGRYLRHLPAYRKVAEGLMDGPIPTSGRAVASVEDVAIFLMLLVAFTENPNADESMPTKRFKSVWESMHERGEVERPWNPNRYTAIRNHLTRLSMIRWIDDRHVEGFIGDDDEYVKGRAAKWAAGRKLVELIERTIGEQEEERGEEKEEHLSYNKDDRSSVITTPPSLCETSDLVDDVIDDEFRSILLLFDTSFVARLRREHFVRPTRSPELWSEMRAAA